MPPKMLYEMRPPGPQQDVQPAPAVHHARPEGQRGDWEWLRFAAGLPSKAIPLASLTANTLLFSGRCILTGLSVQNTGGGGGIINLRDSVDNTGEYVGIYPLAASASATPTLPASGILIEIGIFAEIATATIRGAVYVIPLWHYGFTSPGG